MANIALLNEKVEQVGTDAVTTIEVFAGAQDTDENLEPAVIKIRIVPAFVMKFFSSGREVAGLTKISFRSDLIMPAVATPGIQSKSMKIHVRLSATENSSLQVTKVIFCFVFGLVKEMKTRT